MTGMTGRRAELPAPPEGLSPTLAVFRPSVRSQVQAVGILAGVLAALVLAKGGWPPPQGIAWLLLCLGVGLALFGAKLARKQLWAGAGWVASRGLLRTHYVRTDALVSARDIRSGVDRLIELKDADGRAIGLLSAELHEAAHVLTHVQRDVGVSRKHGLQLPPSTATLLGLRR